MSNLSNTVLAEIEWDEGLSMPVANTENKTLENEVSLTSYTYSYSSNRGL